MTKYKINYELLEQKLALKESVNLNNYLMACVTYNYFEDFKRLVKNYTEHLTDCRNTISNIIYAKRNRIKFFEVIENLIDWDNFYLLKCLFSDYSFIKSLFNVTVEAENKGNVNSVLAMKKILEKIKITEDIKEIFYFNYEGGYFGNYTVDKFRNHIVKYRGKYFTGTEMVDNIELGKIFDTKFHAEKAFKKFEKYPIDCEYIPTGKDFSYV